MKLVQAVLLCFSATTGWAETLPFITEEAFTRPKGHVTIELGGAIIGAEPNFLTGATRTRWDGPLLRLSVSPADNVELDVEWTAAVGALDDPDFGDVSDFGDVVLRTKVRFAHETAGRPEISARLVVALPETDADHGLGPNTLRMSAEVLVSRSAGRFTFHANAGLAIQDQVQELVAQDDFLAYGAAVMGRLVDGLSLGIEAAGLAGKGSPGTDARHEARLGARYEHGRLGLDAAVRRGLGPADGHWGAIAGLTVTMR